MNTSITIASIMSFICLSIIGCNNSYTERASEACASKRAYLDTNSLKSSIFTNDRTLAATINSFNNTQTNRFSLSVWSPTSSKLYMFDLMSHVIQDSISYLNFIDSADRAGINYVSYEDWNQVAINSSNNITLVKDSALLYRYDYPLEDQNGDALEYYPQFNPSCAPSYSSSRGELSYCVRPYDDKHDRSGVRKSPNIEYVIKPSDTGGQYSPAEVSSLYGKGRYGYAVNQFRLRVGDTTYYTSELDPNITLLDHRTMKLSVIGGKSRYDDLSDPELTKKELKDPTSKLQHLVEVSTYTGLEFNPVGKYFYRVFKKGLPLNRNDGLRNTLNDQQAYVQLYSSSMCVIDEVQIDPTIYSAVIIPYGPSLLVAKKLNPAISSLYEQSKIVIE